MPKKMGGEVLSYMRKCKRCADAYVLVVSTSDSPRDRQQMAELGANAYFRKSLDFDEFMKLGEVVKAVLASLDNVN
jgi:DNA-binding NarL/FixJ family response regulator